MRMQLETSHHLKGPWQELIGYDVEIMYKPRFYDTYIGTYDGAVCKISMASEAVAHTLKGLVDMFFFIFTLFIALLYMLSTYWWNVGEMSKCQRFSKTCDVLQYFVKTDTKFARQTCVGGDPMTDPPSQRLANFQRIFWKFTSIPS